jgi:hypothetical protein
LLLAVDFFAFGFSPCLRCRCFSLHPLYIALPAILLTTPRKGVPITTGRFTEVKTDGSTRSNDVEK